MTDATTLLALAERAELTGRYRLTRIRTDDYGPKGRTYRSFQLSHIPDGSHWARLPQVIEIGGLPADTPYGTVFELTLRAQAGEGE